MVPPTKRKQNSKAVGLQPESNQSTEESEDDDKDYMEVEEGNDEEPENFKELGIFLKLIRRFWRCLQCYKNGQDYATVMKLFFSEKCEGKVLTHTRISNTRLT